MRIAIFSPYDTYLPEFVEAVSGHDIKICVGRNSSGFYPNAIVNPGYTTIRDVLEWCDIAVFMYAGIPLSLATAWKETNKIDCGIFVRFVGHEIFYPKLLFQIKWNVVDTICFSTKFMKELFIKQVGGRVPKTCKLIVIPHSVDTEVFRPPKQKKFGKKLCMAGSIGYRKRVYEMLEVLYELHKHDDGWELHLHGEWLRPEYKAYILMQLENYGLLNKVYWLPFMNGQDWLNKAVKWFSNKDIIISNSMFEGFHIGIIEGMSCGVYPLIYDWPGARELYKDEWIYRAQGELIEKILNWNDLNEKEKKRLSEEAREFVKEKYSREVIIPKLRDAILSL